MNPGPFGMAQTGVPFGEVGIVRDWLKIEAKVSRPKHEHEKRPVEGFACARSEVSGKRLWGFFAERFGKPEKFFRDFFVWNYCPLAFMEASGRNFTPDKLPKDERTPLFEVCDDALRRVVQELRPTHVVGVGAFAQKRASVALADLAVKIGCMLHPSPASPLANQGWSGVVERELAAQGIELPHG
jgi:single-strand selective monofunctional uracil DNA glycosylase